MFSIILFVWILFCLLQSEVKCDYDNPNEDEGRNQQQDIVAREDLNNNNFGFRKEGKRAARRKRIGDAKNRATVASAETEVSDGKEAVQSNSILTVDDVMAKNREALMQSLISHPGEKEAMTTPVLLRNSGLRASGSASSRKHEYDQSSQSTSYEAGLKRSDFEPVDIPANKMYAIVRSAKIYLKRFGANRYNSSAGCGHWQKNYIRLHNSILNGEAPRRYLISIAPHQGLADCLGGSITHFIMAYLTNRAFLFAAPDGNPRMSMAYHLKNIRSEMPEDFMGANKAVLMNLTNAGYPNYIDKNVQYGVYLNAGFSSQEEYDTVTNRNIKYSSSELTLLPEDYPHTQELYVTGNRGFSWKLLGNKYHGGHLRNKGFRKETIFKCVFDFLYQLLDVSCNSACMNLKRSIQAHKAEGTIVIGIQIRLGDSVLLNDQLNHGNSQVALTNFRCATTISQHIRTTGRKTILFFISDSLQLRRNMKEIMGNDLLTDVTTVPSHSTESSEDMAAHSIRSSSADMHLFSLAQIHVISRKSGFGQKAAFLSEFSTKHHIFFADEGKVCSLDRFDQPNHVAQGWSGI